MKELKTAQEYREILDKNTKALENLDYFIEQIEKSIANNGYNVWVRSERSLAIEELFREKGFSIEYKTEYLEYYISWS